MTATPWTLEVWFATSPTFRPVARGTFDEVRREARSYAGADARGLRLTRGDEVVTLDASGRESDEDRDAREAREDEARRLSAMAIPKHVITYASQGHVRYARGTGTAAALRTLCGAPVPPDGTGAALMYSVARGLSVEGRRAWTLCAACVARMGAPGKADR